MFQFQFHKGTIKTPLPIRCPHLVINFNSIKVRLKRELLPIFNTWVNPFQFHKGTIKTPLCLIYVVSVTISIP